MYHAYSGAPLIHWPGRGRIIAEAIATTTGYIGYDVTHTCDESADTEFSCMKLVTISDVNAWVTSSLTPSKRWGKSFSPSCCQLFD